MNFIEKHSKILAVSLCLLTSGPIVSTMYAKEVQPGWHGEGADRYYVLKSNRQTATGLTKIDKELYYFNNNGEMQFGWQTVSDETYYFQQDGTAATGSVTIQGSEYNFQKEGVLLHGWSNDGKSYYDEKGNKTSTNWVEENGSKYYFDADGNCVTGWQEIDGQKYFFGEDGKMATGQFDVDGKTYTIRELASQEMKNSAGATWDAATAGNAIGTWSASFGEQIDVVVSNNDGMGMSMFNAWAKDNKVPTFGYDANSDAVAAIAEGYGGTISQHADVQAYLTLRVLRNALDGVDIDTGIGTEDDAGNVLSSDVFTYNKDQRSYYALNVAVTADNYKDFLDSTVTYAPVSNQLNEKDHAKKSVWLNIYNASDNFLSSTYQPLLEKYDDLLNLDVEYIGGDGQTESNITNRLGNPDKYDAFAINMVKTDNAASYTGILK